MKIFLAGATGVIGQRLALLLRDARHEVIGTTRDPARPRACKRSGSRLSLLMYLMPML